jgi:hypothetical protein
MKDEQKKKFLIELPIAVEKALAEEGKENGRTRLKHIEQVLSQYVAQKTAANGQGANA